MRLPIHLPTLPDELLSSWLVRLAHAHGDKVQSLVYRMLGRRSGLNRQGDLNRGGNIEVLARIADAAKLPPSELFGTTLSAYVDKLWCEISPKGSQRWVRAVTNHRHVAVAGQQFCPRCLEEDEIPYLRRTWRLSLHCVCAKHSCLLLNRCQVCNSPVLCHKSDVFLFVPKNSNGVTLCWQCRSDYRGMASVQVYEPSLAVAQQSLLWAPQAGFLDLGNQHIRSTLFFDGLWMLWSFWDAQQQFGEWELKATITPRHQRTTRYKGIDRQDALKRLRLLRLTQKYLSDWPMSFVKDMRLYKCGSGQLFRFYGGTGMHTVPFWLWQPVHLGCSRAFYVPTDQEIEHSIRYVRSRDGTVRVNCVCEALNMSTRCNKRVSKLVRESNALL
jgi:hypothetical protein